jgi:hypothetical protein
MFSEQLQGPSYLWEHHPCNTVSGTLPILLPEELHDERNVQLVAKQRNAPEDDAGQEAVDEQQSEKVGDEYLEETTQAIDDEFGLQESEGQLDEQDEYEDEDLDEDNDDDEDEENEEEDDDEASSVEEQRVDDALEVSTTTDVTVASSSSNIDRVKALATAIAGVSPSPRAARGRADDGRASWAKMKTIQRFTNDGVNHPQYVICQSSEEDEGD